ncbi:MAG: hypothetical protein AAF533_17280 [Acidobacteriota bacterium]
MSEAPNFGARVRDDSGLVKTLDHQFPSANTAIPYLLRDSLPDADRAIEAHREFNEGVMRVDLFGLREGGRIDGELIAPLRPELPVLTPGESYLVEAVIRTVKMGHLFTQGTADSNEVWLELTVRDGDRLLGSSGLLEEPGRSVDEHAHFVNSFVIDRDGNRIDRRNAQDIFVALYNHQIPPGAADVVHYRLDLPPDLAGPVTIETRLRYRKFDTNYLRMFTDDPGRVNDLPILELAQDSVTLPVAGGPAVPEVSPRDVPEWERTNDYGIGLLRKGGVGQLRQAQEAFETVEALGRPDGPLNLARVYLKEGLVQQHAPEALARAAASEPAAPPWSLLWFGAQVAARNGDHVDAVAKLEDLISGGFPEAVGRGFDFSKDYRVLAALGNSTFQLGLRKRGEQRDALMNEARGWYEQALELDPENLAAHWGLKQVHEDLGNEADEQRHAALHARYKPDDNARDRAVAQARLRYPAANRAAEAVVIYELRDHRTAVGQ